MIGISPIRFGFDPKARKRAVDQKNKKQALTASAQSPQVTAFLNRTILPAVAGNPPATGRELLSVVESLRKSDTSFDSVLRENFADTEFDKAWNAVKEMEKLGLVEEEKGSLSQYPEPEYRNSFTLGYRLTDLGRTALGK